MSSGGRRTRTRGPSPEVPSEQADGDGRQAAGPSAATDDKEAEGPSHIESSDGSYGSTPKWRRPRLAEGPPEWYPKESQTHQGLAVASLGELSRQPT